MKSKNFKKLIFLFLLISLFVFGVVFANEPGNGAGAVPGFEEIDVAIRGFHQVLLGIAGIVAIIILVFIGLRFMFSTGDPEAITSAQKYLFSLLIGLLIVVFSYALVRTLEIDIEVPGPPERIVVPEIGEPPVGEPPVGEPPVGEPPEEDPTTDKALREAGFEGFVFRRGVVDLNPLIIPGEKAIIRDFRRIFRANAFEPFELGHIGIHHPRDRHKKYIYRYGVILFEKPNFRGRCKLMERGGFVGWAGIGEDFLSAISFVMPTEKAYRDHDRPRERLVIEERATKNNIILYENSILERTYSRPNLKKVYPPPSPNPQTETNNTIISPGMDIIIGEYEEYYNRLYTPLEEHIIIDNLRGKNVASIRIFSHWPGKYLLILRDKIDGVFTKAGNCRIVLRSTADFQGLKWAGLFGRRKTYTIQIVPVLRVYY